MSHTCDDPASQCVVARFCASDRRGLHRLLYTMHPADPSRAAGAESPPHPTHYHSAHTYTLRIYFAPHTLHLLRCAVGAPGNDMDRQTRSPPPSIARARPVCPLVFSLPVLNGACSRVRLPRTSENKCGHPKR